MGASREEVSRLQGGETVTTYGTFFLAAADDVQATRTALSGLLETWGPFLLGAAGLTLIMMSTARRIRRSRSAPTADVRRHYAEFSKRSGSGREADDALRELDQLSREVIGRLDTRFAKLEAVIRDADRRIDHLSRLLREARGEPVVDVVIGDESRSTPSPSGAKPGDAELQDRVQRLHDAGRSPFEIAESIGRPVGEVELMIALRRVREGAPASGAGH